MINRPKLMPEDPDLATGLYTRLRRQMKKLCIKYDTIENVLKNSTRQSNRESVDHGIEKGRNLMKKSKEERWSELAQVWVDKLIYIAITENATPHTEQLAKGGELLTLLWVLLGHLGFGQNVAPPGPWYGTSTQ